VNRFFIAVALLTSSFQTFATIEESILPSMDNIYNQDFGHKVNTKQKELMLHAIQKKAQKLRIMTYNMLYNAKDAEEKLLPKYRWEFRKPRLLEYLSYAKADIIGSQELQEDQIQEVMSVLGANYGYYGEKTRQNEGRSDTNAIFFNKNRIELLESKTISYKDEQCKNAFTYCLFKDKVTNKKFTVLNTKLSWGSPDRRLAEAVQLNEFSNHLSAEDPIIVLGDFNIYPFILHKRNIFFDGDYVEQVLLGENLKDAKIKSAFGHFGPLCSITNSKETLEPFIGPQLVGFVLDHILVNDHVEVSTHGIDTAKVNGEFPSDHFPVIADINFKDE
jgi:endonuclease/exonuclease/phosphatase family metal-dependent hydrolase